MSAPVRGSNNGPSAEGPSKYAPKRSLERDPDFRGTQTNDSVPPSTASASGQVPWKRSKERPPFSWPPEDDLFNYDHTPKSVRSFEEDPGFEDTRVNDSVPMPPPREIKRASRNRSRHSPAFAGDIAIMDLREDLASYHLPELRREDRSRLIPMIRLLGVAAVIVVGVIAFRFGFTHGDSTPRPSLSDLSRVPGTGSARKGAESSYRDALKWTPADEAAFQQAGGASVTGSLSRSPSIGTAVSPAGSAPFKAGAREPGTAVKDAFEQAGVAAASRPLSVGSPEVTSRPAGSDLSKHEDDGLRRSDEAAFEDKQSYVAAQSVPGRPLSDDEICKRDVARLGRLRISRGRDEILLFAHELGCADLRPQVDRLRESVE